MQNIAIIFKKLNVTTEHIVPHNKDFPGKFMNIHNSGI